VKPDIGKLDPSVELMKAGFENAQNRISFIDAKVGIAVGLLLVLLPAPLVIVAWLTGLQGEAASHIYSACREHWVIVAIAGASLILATVGDFAAILCGVRCLTPRGPKGYGNLTPFKTNGNQLYYFLCTTLRRPVSFVRT